MSDDLMEAEAAIRRAYEVASGVRRRGLSEALEIIAALRERVAPAKTADNPVIECGLCGQKHLLFLPCERVAPVEADALLHDGGSLNGPSRLGASPARDTGGEIVQRVAPVEADGPRGIEFVDKLRPDRPKE